MCRNLNRNLCDAFGLLGRRIVRKNYKEEKNKEDEENTTPSNLNMTNYA